MHHRPAEMYSGGEGILSGFVTVKNWVTKIVVAGCNVSPILDLAPAVSKLLHNPFFGGASLHRPSQNHCIPGSRGELTHIKSENELLKSESSFVFHCFKVVEVFMSSRMGSPGMDRLKVSGTRALPQCFASLRSQASTKDP